MKKPELKKLEGKLRREGKLPKGVSLARRQDKAIKGFYARPDVTESGGCRSTDRQHVS